MRREMRRVILLARLRKPRYSCEEIRAELESHQLREQAQHQRRPAKHQDDPEGNKLRGRRDMKPVTKDQMGSDAREGQSGDDHHAPRRQEFDDG